MKPERDPIWIFGYGSLMWNPGFAYATRSIARLNGYHRALCIRSTHYRGTMARPGLVFGLDWGGACDGVAFEVAGNDADEVLSIVRRRELIYGVYREAHVAITLDTPAHRVVGAVTFIAEREHPSYARRAPTAKQAAIVRAARGIAGPNLEYLLNTLAHLRDLSLRDRDIERVAVIASAYSVRSNAYAGGLNAKRVESIRVAWAQRRDVAGQLPSTMRPSDQNRFQHRSSIAKACEPG